MFIFGVGGIIWIILVVLLILLIVGALRGRARLSPLETGGNRRPLSHDCPASTHYS